MIAAAAAGDSAVLAVGQRAVYSAVPGTLEAAGMHPHGARMDTQQPAVAASSRVDAGGKSITAAATLADAAVCAAAVNRSHLHCCMRRLVTGKALAVLLRVAGA